VKDAAKTIEGVVPPSRALVRMADEGDHRNG
jgi:hypothetical protein